MPPCTAYHAPGRHCPNQAAFTLSCNGTPTYLYCTDCHFNWITHYDHPKPNSYWQFTPLPTEDADTPPNAQADTRPTPKS